MITLLLKKKQNKQIFSFNTKNKILEFYRNNFLYKIELKNNYLSQGIDYEINKNEFLRITKIHFIQIVGCVYLCGIFNYSILEK